MKKLITLFIIISAFCFKLSAQEETLVGSGPVSHGGFGAPVVKFTQIKDEYGLIVGGRGGWIINHSFVIGGGGYALVTDISSDLYYNPGRPYLEFGYGGLELEYIFHSEKLIHSSLYALIGGGTLTYRESWDDYGWDWDWNWNKDEFFIFEPAINIEINIASFCRLNAGASYRFISGLHLDDLSSEDFSGPSGVISLKFGKF